MIRTTQNDNDSKWVQPETAVGSMLSEWPPPFRNDSWWLRFSPSPSLGHFGAIINDSVTSPLPPPPPIAEPKSPMTNIIIVICFSLLIVVSLAGNCLVVRTLFKQRGGLCSNSTNILIGVLAISDLMMTTFNIPFTVADIILQDWIFGDFFCILVSFVQANSVYVSSFTMAVIAIDRCKAIYKFRPAQPSSSSAAASKSSGSENHHHHARPVSPPPGSDTSNTVNQTSDLSKEPPSSPTPTRQPHRYGSSSSSTNSVSHHSSSSVSSSSCCCFTVMMPPITRSSLSTVRKGSMSPSINHDHDDDDNDNHRTEVSSSVSWYRPQARSPRGHHHRHHHRHHHHHSKQTVVQLFRQCCCYCCYGGSNSNDVQQRRRRRLSKMNKSTRMAITIGAIWAMAAIHSLPHTIFNRVTVIDLSPMPPFELEYGAVGYVIPSSTETSYESINNNNNNGSTTPDSTDDADDMFDDVEVDNNDADDDDDNGSGSGGGGGGGSSPYEYARRCIPMIPPGFGEKFSLWLTVYTTVTQYVIPLSCAGIIYTRIAFTILGQGKVGNMTETRAQRLNKIKRRRLLMLVLIVAIFAICWLPFNVYYLLLDFGITKSYNHTAFLVCLWMATSSVCYNPFVYCWLNESFRREATTVWNQLKRLVCCCCCFWRPTGR